MAAGARGFLLKDCPLCRTMCPMRMAAAQINTTTGDVRGNLRLALAGLEHAQEAGADLLVLPAWALSGWQPQDLARESRFRSLQESALDRLASVSRAIPVVVAHAALSADGQCVPAATLLAGGERAAVLGLSGGIDSAVVAALAADALGPEPRHGASDAHAFLVRGGPAGCGGRGGEPGHRGVDRAR